METACIRTLGATMHRGHLQMCFAAQLRCAHAKVAQPYQVAIRAMPRAFCTASRQAQEVATQAMERAASWQRASGTPATAEAAAACQAFLDAHGSLGVHGRNQWWADRAAVEEESQLNQLSKALPRGGRIAPQMLEDFAPRAPGMPETLLDNLVATLGGGTGLAGALEVRSAVRNAFATAGPNSPVGFALGRLDRRLQERLSIWFSPGLMQVDAVDVMTEAVSEVISSVALSAAPGLAGEPHQNHRCFVLRHPLMAPRSGGLAPPLMVAHASLLKDLPGSFVEAVADAPAETCGAGCLWAIGAAGGSLDGGPLHGLGLAHVLRKRAVEMLRAEVGNDALKISALVPLKGLAATLRSQRSWEAEAAKGLTPELSEALRRAIQGATHPGGLAGVVEFVDADGDTVRFSCKQGVGLEVELGQSPPRRVSRLRLVGGGASLQFVTEPGSQAMQVDAAEGSDSQGKLQQAAELAESAGLLPAEMRDVLLRKSFELLTRKVDGGRRISESAAHFHLTGGAALHSLHWRPGDAVAAQAGSLGVIANFLYDGLSNESRNAAAYLQQGSIAITQAAAAVQ